MAKRVEWPDDDSGLPTWDQRILALCPSSIDETQIVENLRLTPTQRLERLQDMADALDQLHAGRRK